MTDLNAALARMREAYSPGTIRDIRTVGEFLDAVPEGAVLVAIPEGMARAFAAGRGPQHHHAEHYLMALTRAALKAAS